MGTDCIICRDRAVEGQSRAHTRKTTRRLVPYIFQGIGGVLLMSSVCDTAAAAQEAESKHEPRVFLLASLFDRRSQPTGRTDQRYSIAVAVNICGEAGYGKAPLQMHLCNTLAVSCHTFRCRLDEEVEPRSRRPHTRQPPALCDVRCVSTPVCSSPAEG